MYSTSQFRTSTLVCISLLSFNAMARTLAQLHAPPHLRGRAIGLFNVGSLGCRAFSGVTIGFGGGIVGVHWSLGLSAIALMAALAVVLMWLSRADASATAV